MVMAERRFFTPALALGLIFLLCISGGGAQKCKTQSRSVLAGLPRVNRKLAAVKEWKDFRAPMLLYEDGANRLEIDPRLQEQLDRFSDDPGSEFTGSPSYLSDPDSSANFLDVLYVWIIVGFSLTVIALVIIPVVWCFCQCASCCFPLRDRVFSALESKQVRRRRASGFALVGLFVVLVITFVLLGELKGNQGLTAAQWSMVTDAPDRLARTAQKMARPVPALFSSVVGSRSAGSFVGLLRRLNTSFDEEVGLEEFHRVATCIGDVVEDKSGEINGSITYLEDLLADVSRQLDAFDADRNAQIKTQLASLTGLADDVPSVAGALQATLATWSGGLAKIDVAAIAGPTCSDYNGKGRASCEAAGCQRYKNKKCTKPGGLAGLEQSVADVDAKLAAAQGPVAAMADPATGMPSPGAVRTLRTSLSQFADSPDTGTAAAVQQELQTMQTRLENMPDPSALADTLRALNDTLAATAANIAGVEAALATTATTLEEDLSIPALRADLDRAHDLTTRVNLGQVVAALDDVSAVTDVVVGDVAGLKSRADVVFAVRDRLVPCLASLEGIVGRINASFIRLPAGGPFDAIIDNTAELRRKVAEQSFGNMTSFFEDLEESMDNLPNISRVRADVGSLNSSVKEAQAAIKSAQAQLDDVAKDTADVNLTDSLNAARDLRAQLGKDDTTVSAEQLSALEAASSTRDKLVTDISDARAALDAWARLSGGSVECLGGTDAGKTCAGAAAEVGSCGGGGVCPFPETQLRAAIATLSSLETDIADQPTMADLSSALAQARADASAVPKIDKAQLNSFSSAVSTFRGRMPEYEDRVKELASSANDVQDLDVKDLPQQWDDAYAALEEQKGKKQEYTDALEELKEAYNEDGDGIRAKSKEFFDLEKRVYDMLSSGLSPRLARIEQGALDRVVSAKGFGAAVAEAAAALDPVLDAFRPSDGADRAECENPCVGAGCTAESDGVLQCQVRGEKMRRVWDTVDALADGSGRLAEDGALAYLVGAYRALENSESGTPETAAQFKAKYEDAGTLLFAGYLPSDGGAVRSYRDDDKCVTRACLQATVEVYNSGSIQQIFGSDVPVTVSRETALFLPYILPICAAALALVMLAKPNSCTSGCFGCCAFLNIVVAFLVFGMVIWPLVVGMDGMCAGKEPLGVQILQSLPAGGACRQLGLPTNPDAPAECRIELLNGNVTLHVDIARAGVELLGGSSCGSDAALDSFWAAVSESVDAFDQEAMDALAEAARSSGASSDSDGGGFGFEGRAKEDVQAFLQGVEGHLRVFVADSLSQPLSCAETALTYEQTLTPLCCDAPEALYWVAASWYWIGFVMLLVGIPAACLAPGLVNTRVGGRASSKLASRQLSAYLDVPCSSPEPLPLGPPGSAANPSNAGSVAVVVNGDDGKQFADMSSEPLVAEPVSFDGPPPPPDDPRPPPPPGDSPDMATFELDLGDSLSGSHIRSSSRFNV